MLASHQKTTNELGTVNMIHSVLSPKLSTLFSKMPVKKLLVQMTNVPLNYSNSLKAEKWRILEHEVTSILNSTQPSKSLEELYRTVEDLYILNYMPWFYNFQMLLEAHLINKLGLIEAQRDNIVHAIAEIWTEFYNQTVIIKNIFLRIDRSSRKIKYNTIQSVSLSIFTNVIILNPLTQQNLILSLLNQITDERNGNIVDTFLLQHVIKMFTQLQIYGDYFESMFLQYTKIYYEKEATKMISDLATVPTYLRHVNRRICEEKNRATIYLEKRTGEFVVDIVLNEFIDNHLNKILDDGFETMLDNKMFQELKLLYNFCLNIGTGIDHLANFFRNFITRKGESLMKTSDKTVMNQLIAFRDCLIELTQSSFENDKRYHENLRIAFEHFLNTSSSKVAHWLAKYVDKKLCSNEASSDDLEQILTKVLIFFRYIQGKDMFMAYYKKYLSVRLLFDKSASQDAEHSMILKLKYECGNDFTANLEGMIQDITLSRNLNSLFKHYKNVFSHFSANVLTSSQWPNYPQFKVNLPTELVSYQEDFQSFYLFNHNGRKLIWQPSLGYCIVRAQFECGTKELQASIFQTVILELFNKHTKMVVKDMLDQTNFDKKELKRTLKTLITGKNKILIKQIEAKRINDIDSFMINENFQSKLFRVKINQSQLAGLVENESEIEKNVIIDRQFQIDAAIVRILKKTKTIKHNQLICELCKILNIPITITDMKKRIELLIEREYIERDQSTESIYNYIA